MKKNFTHKKRNGQEGQVVMASVLVFMTLSLVVVIGISVPIASQIRNTSMILESRKAVANGEVLNDDALYRLNSGRSLPTTIVLSLNDSTSTAQISDVGTAKRVLTTSLSKFTSRSSSAMFNIGGSAAPISYALHTGHGGFDIKGGSQVVGDVFSNGNITGQGGGNILGSATAASTLSATLVADNTNTGTIAGSVDVGKVNSVQQIAQGFIVATSTPITAFSFYVKKTGAPANGIVRVFKQTGGGNVGSAQIGTTGSLSAASVTGTYDWVEVYPYSPITLNPGDAYYVTIEVQGSNSANYYTFATNDGAYSDGIFKTRTKTGTSWSGYVNASPASKDLLFGAYLGGVTYISGNGWDSFVISGDANAGTVNSTNAGGAIYCQGGTMNNKACDMSKPIPTATPLPIFTEKIVSWKALASAGTVINSSWTLGGGEATSTLGATQVVGDLTVSGGSVLTLNGPLYVTGTLTVSGGSLIKLAPTYSTGDEFVVASYIRLTGGGTVTGSGTAGSYVIVASDAVDCSSPCNGSRYVATADGGTESMVLVAPNGSLDITGGADLKAAMAQTIYLDGGSRITYEPTLADITFTTSGSTGWTVESWKEVE